MKKTTKTNKVKPMYTVDITKCNDAHDVLVAFAEAKQKAGLPITDSELDALLDEYATIIVVVKANPACTCECKPEKKCIFKRFWNWLKYAFTW